MNKEQHFQALLNKVAFSGSKPNEFMLSDFYLTGEDSSSSINDTTNIRNTDNTSSGTNSTIK